MARPGEYILSVLNGEMAGHVVALDRETLTIGRNAANDLCLPLDPRISRWHAQLTVTPEGIVLEDRNSGNGTWVGSTRVYTPVTLPPGAQVRVGRTWLQLDLVAPEPAPEVDVSGQIVWVEEDEDYVETTEEPAESVVYPVEPDRPSAAALVDAEELRRRLHAFEVVSVALGSTLDMETVLYALLDTVMQVMKADRGFLLLVDEETGEPVPRVVRQQTAEEDGPMQISRHIVDRALERRAAIQTSDAMHDRRFREMDSVVGFQIRSAACVPILRGERVLGAVYLDTTSASKVFSKADLEMLTSLANQAAIAIENARLYTDLREAYDDLRAAQEQILRTEKLSTIGALSASIAHDMGNVVTPLMPLVRLLLRTCEPDTDLAEMTERQMHRLSAMITRLRSFSRPSSIERGPVDIHEVLEETTKLLQTEANHRGVELAREYADGLPPVLGDAQELDRVFLNIILNGIQAAPEGEGKVTVRTETDEGEVAISVIDNGPGIPEDVLPHLFEPLFTTKEGGTGLGLFSCKRIVEDEHNGSIEIDTRPEGGTTVTVRLAQAEPPEDSRPTDDDLDE
ncbi:MAG: GAF domain-containing protein [Armatimonadetes bacterium]|nr:GAF domain-containing protein [Armatimonadota bacterium]